MESMELNESKNFDWLDHPLVSYVRLNAETILYIIILLLAVFSRFYDLGTRVMSHDENSHVYYSWRFANGQGFAHDPLMHGPFQFHFIALSYFMFGDNDFTARILAAVLSIGTVGFMWFYRRYLGKSGALIAAVLMLISPFMLYYGRYVRNEAYAAFFGVVMLWGLLRYLESGHARYMYLVSAVTALHFTAKETSFIYTAQAMVFLAFYFIYRVSKDRWENPDLQRWFSLALIAALVLFGSFGGYLLVTREAGDLSATETAAPSVPGEDLSQLPSGGGPALPSILVIIGILALIVAAYFLIRGYGWGRLRNERSLSLIILLGTLVLPHLAAFPVRLLGWLIPTNASEVINLTMTDILRIGLFLIPIAIVAVIVGLVWNYREWLINAAIFYAIFIVFYTSVFTNGAGFFTGLVGSLGYWLEQQGVERGSQPWYYYWAVQMPIYEYLPALGTALGFVVAFFDFLRRPKRTDQEDEGEPAREFEYTANNANGSQAVPIFPLLGFWAVTSLLSYTIAGEKMPWLTVHIAWPAILCAAWGLGKLVDRTDWGVFRATRGWLVLVLLPVFLLSLASALGSVFGTAPPFQGKELSQLQATSTFITSLLVTFASGAGLIYMLKSWSAGQIVRILVLYIFAFMGFLTARSAIQAAYINYDNANELLVYAHSAGGVKTALDQIEEISQRTTDGLAVEVAYDNETSYPYWWYLRNYNNARYYGENPSRSLRDVPLILVGDANFGKIEPVVGNLYHRFDYIRLWWPNQDYYNLTWERIRNALTNPAMRAALFQIWLNRDYTKYGEVAEKDMSLVNWSPSARMRLYVRKDIVNQLWNYGAAPVAEEIEPDPFEGKHESLIADRIIGDPGGENSQFQKPRDLAVAADGTIYVVDSENHRIQHLNPDGSIINTWGTFGDATTGAAQGGTFNQPWGIGLGPDGAVYVADTWNHRVQKFTAEGDFLTMWGYFGQGEGPLAFWGPRDVAVNSEGEVFITDTGNKRVVVFDETGGFVTEFGGPGLGPGELDEPVGISVDQNGLVYVADTWNQRIQVFAKGADGNYSPIREWELWAWYGQSLDNKPYLGVDNRGSVFAVDPEGYRVLQYSDSGEPVRSWGDFGTGSTSFGLPASVAVDLDGNVWISDSGNGRLMHFTISELVP